MQRQTTLKNILEAIFSCVFLLSTFSLYAHDNEIESRDSISDQVVEPISVPLSIPSWLLSSESVLEIDAEVFVLKNGMRVCLKKTAFDPNEVSVQLMALGGYANLPPSKRGSGELAPQIAIRSGIGNYSYEQLHALFYEHSLEFEGKIQPFCRLIEGSSETEEIGLLLHLIYLYFTKSHFDYSSFHQVILKAKEALAKRPHIQSRSCEEEYMDFHTESLSFFHGLSTEEVEKANFQEAYHFFKRCFANPADFVCVIVGDFDSEKVKKSLEKTLAAIPSSQRRCFPQTFSFPSFPEGIQTMQIRRTGRVDAVMRLTFPIKVKTNPYQLEQAETTAAIIKERLMWECSKRANPMPEIKAVVEFPYYPYPQPLWLVIELVLEAKQVPSLSQMILEELSKMQADGVVLKEAAFLKNRMQISDQLLKKDNYYWLTVLSNYLLWNWDLKMIEKNYKTYPCFDCSEIQKGLREHFSLKNYTLTSVKP